MTIKLIVKDNEKIVQELDITKPGIYACEIEVRAAAKETIYNDDKFSGDAFIICDDSYCGS